MLLLRKSINTFNFYQDRDMLYKCYINNIYEIPKIKKSIVLQKKDKLEDIYPYISSLILLLDKIPFLIKIKKSSDKKILGSIIGTKIALNREETISFLLRIKNEGAQYDILKKDYKKNSYILKMNIFDEFLSLYDKYSMLQDFSLNFQFKNCKNEKEKELVLLSLINT